ncbi:MAG: zeta toxin family protein [Defluviitaleaceae bacterium]|nr:zeta toxin family protein [Defluviitaleaceae bacterium]
MNAKTYTLFAGVNGAGKSTFYKLLDINFGIRVNVDEIVKDKFQHDWRNPSAQMQAGRIAVKILRECLQGNVSFNQETTLTGNTILTNINKAKAGGFIINLYYVGLESAELSIERVAIRERAGGHGIPEEDLRRRYINSFVNLKQALPLCDNVQIYDNSGRDPLNILNPLLVVRNRNLVLWNDSCPQYLMNVLQDYNRNLSEIASS